MTARARDLDATSGLDDPERQGDELDAEEKTRGGRQIVD